MTHPIAFAAADIPRGAPATLDPVARTLSPANVEAPDPAALEWVAGKRRLVPRYRWDSTVYIPQTADFETQLPADIDPRWRIMAELLRERYGEDAEIRVEAIVPARPIDPAVWPIRRV